MPFQPGLSGNPKGRPKGTAGGRTLAVQALDEMLAEDANLDTLRDALAAYLHKDPMRFFREIIMPLLPKHAVLDMGPREPVRWGRLLDSFPPPTADDAAKLGQG